MNSDNRDPVLRAIEELRQALAEGFPGREHDWTERVGNGLAHLEGALRGHIGQAEKTDGIFSGVDLQRPTFVRQVNGLRLGLRELVRDLHTLRDQVRLAGEAFRPAASHTDPDRLPRPIAQASVPRFGELRSRVESFLARVEQQRGKETRLVLESVTTDIGAGD
jgi:hypothetical protein